MKRRKSLDSSGPLKTVAEAELAIGRRQVAEEAIDRLNNEIHVIDARGNVMPPMAQQKRNDHNSGDPAGVVYVFVTVANRPQPSRVG